MGETVQFEGYAERKRQVEAAEAYRRAVNTTVVGLLIPCALLLWACWNGGSAWDSNDPIPWLWPLLRNLNIVGWLVGIALFCAIPIPIWCIRLLVHALWLPVWVVGLASMLDVHYHPVKQSNSVESLTIALAFPMAMYCLQLFLVQRSARLEKRINTPPYY